MRMLPAAALSMVVSILAPLVGPTGIQAQNRERSGLTDAQSPLPLPIVDVHMHAMRAEAQGPPPLSLCAPGIGFAPGDSGRGWAETFMGILKDPPCSDPVTSPMSTQELQERNLAIMERRNVIGVVSGSELDRWRTAAPGRIIPSLHLETGPGLPPIDSLRAWFEAGRYAALGEITNQYVGSEPSDPDFAPYFALAEELDIPVGYHMGPGPPGVPHLGSHAYRGRMSSALLMEEVLMRHPDLRLYIMHAGWPMLDDMLALLWTHPHVYVDVGVISWGIPRAGFHSYLQRIVEAGFGKRVLFGSDQMVWPETLEVAIQSIETADFLSEEEKRDILYNNAARFFRFSQEEIARHHGWEPDGLEVTSDPLDPLEATMETSVPEVVEIEGGIELTYVERGSGEPVVHVREWRELAISPLTYPKLDYGRVQAMQVPTLLLDFPEIFSQAMSAHFQRNP